jgi:osmoprotectant transport system ATP-binding protein
MLMDEPYSALDPIVRARLQDELLALQDRLHKTIVLVTHDIDEAVKLADLVAVLNVGGVLEQLASPEELLRAPATPFVESFLGRERGLKRLALHTVGQVELERGPVVGTAATVEDAKAAMVEAGTTWVGVLDGDRLLGWTWERDLAGVATVGEAPRERFRAFVGLDTSLREALDAIVNSRTGVAVVLDGDRYLGMVRLAQLSEGLA